MIICIYMYLVTFSKTNNGKKMKTKQKWLQWRGRKQKRADRNGGQNYVDYFVLQFGLRNHIRFTQCFNN